jgi:diaminohydroxyphosphoribosylaminopyrimidine deaminase / 5-amino-6-(5-phosphoribosylamino)uracil reductase
MISHADRKWMRLAIRLSRRWMGKTHPNPSVGCVIADERTLHSTGVHRGPGTPHAEMDAIRSCPPEHLARSTCYVTLEPCNHHGRTPPCTDAIISAGIHRVVIALPDLNPHVAGGGTGVLRAAGLEVETGVLGEAALDILEPWLIWITTGKPFVVLKMAMSTDGHVATVTGQSQWISNIRSRRMVHRLRERMMGIMVGAGTILSDNPELTARTRGRITAAPARIIVDRFAEAPENARVFMSSLPGKTLWILGESACNRPKKAAGCRIVVCPELDNSLDLEYLMRYLGGEEKLESVLLEGGPSLAFSMIEQKLVHKVMFFMAPKLIGGASAPVVLGGRGFPSLESAPELSYFSTRRVGGDVLIEGYLGDRPCLRELSGK